MMMPQQDLQLINLLQCFKHSSSVVNLLSLPPQPPYMNSSHFPDLLLKNQWGMWPSQGPESLGRLQMLIAPPKLNDLSHKQHVIIKLNILLILILFL